MNRTTILVLIAFNALFATVLVGEWVAEQDVSEISRPTAKTSDTQEDELPQIDLEATSEEQYSDLVERPLFIKGRKPVAEPEPESVPVAAVKKVEALNWELTGIFTTPKGVTAFFSRTGAKIPKDNYKKLKLGEELEGWKLSAISLENVTLSQTGESKTLPLRKVKPKMPTPETIQAVNNRVPPQRNVPPVAVPPPQLQTREAPQSVIQQNEPQQTVIEDETEQAQEQ
jgi:hypothetical protein